MYRPGIGIRPELIERIPIEMYSMAVRQAFGYVVEPNNCGMEWVQVLDPVKQQDSWTAAPVSPQFQSDPAVTPAGRGSSVLIGYVELEQVYGGGHCWAIVTRPLIPLQNFLPEPH